MPSMLLSNWLKDERGRAARLARHLRVAPSMVNKMAAGTKPVPLDHCPYIEKFTEGAVTCEELRPDQASYFALIRELAGAVRPVTPAPGPSAAVIAVPGYTGPDRRGAGAGRDAGTDHDRRGAPQGV